MKGGEKMDVMNLLSAAPAVANVSQLQGNGGVAGNSAVGNGEAVFQKQLLSVIGSQASETTEGEGETVSQSLLLSNSAALLASSEELSEEGLSAIIDQLLDQLDQIEHLIEQGNTELTEEQQAVLQSLLQQVTALVDILTNSNEGSKSALLLSTEAFNADFQSSNTSNAAIIKLADQLLVLQQTLQNSTNKVLFAQPATALAHEQLQVIQAKIKELVGEVKQKAAENAGNAQAVTAAPKAEADAASHLQRLTQEASYSNVANKAQQSKLQAEAVNEEQTLSKDTTYSAIATKSVETAASTTTQATGAPVAAEQPQMQAVLPEFHLRSDNARDFLTHLAKSTSGATSAYVLADEFADTMKELIVQRFNVSSLNGVTEAKLTLTPEHLGQVDVKITMQNGLLTAVFQAENAMAKDALESQMVQLRASLAQQGITVEKIEVSQSQLASQLNQGQKQGSHNHQQNDQSQSRHKEDTFEEEMLLNVTNQELGFGRAVNETV